MYIHSHALTHSQMQKIIHVYIFTHAHVHIQNSPEQIQYTVIQVNMHTYRLALSSSGLHLQKSAKFMSIVRPIIESILRCTCVNKERTWA